MLPRANYPFKDQVQTINIAKHIFSFFNCHDLRALPIVCKDWQLYIKDEVCKEDKKTAQLVDTYKKFFKLYYHDKAGFLLDINISNFFYKPELYPEVDGTLPFIKEGSADELLKMDMYFWSPGGFNFYQLDKTFVDSTNRPEKLTWFSSAIKKDEQKALCKIKFTPDKAILLEPETKKAFREKRNYTTISVIMQQGNQAQPPSDKELIIFDRCSQREVELLLQFILSGKIEMLVAKQGLKLKLLCKFDDTNLLLVLEKGRNNIIKMRKDECWHDVSFRSSSRGVAPLSGEKTMEFWCAEESGIDKIKIIEDLLSSGASYFSTRDGKKIKLTRLEINQETCVELGFLNLNAEYPRPTPLDVYSSLLHSLSL